jgi:hypothetical protein
VYYKNPDKWNIIGFAIPVIIIEKYLLQESYLF